MRAEIILAQSSVDCAILQGGRVKEAHELELRDKKSIITRRVVPSFVQLPFDCALVQEGLRVREAERTIWGDILSHPGYIEFRGTRRVPLLANRSGFADTEKLHENLVSVADSLFNLLCGLWKETVDDMDYVSEAIYSSHFSSSVLEEKSAADSDSSFGRIARLLYVDKDQITRLSANDIIRERRCAKVVFGTLDEIAGLAGESSCGACGVLHTALAWARL